MERLLYSSSPTPTLKFHLKPTPFLPPLRRVDSLKFGLPSIPRPEFRRLNLVSCKHENPSTPPPLVYSRTGSVPKSHFHQQNVHGAPVQQKVLFFFQLFRKQCTKTCVFFAFLCVGYVFLLFYHVMISVQLDLLEFFFSCMMMKFQISATISGLIRL